MSAIDAVLTADEAPSPAASLASALRVAEAIASSLVASPGDPVSLIEAHKRLAGLSTRIGDLATSPAEEAELCHALFRLRDTLDSYLLAADALRDIDLGDAVQPMLARSAVAACQVLRSLVQCGPRPSPVTSEAATGSPR